MTEDELGWLWHDIAQHLQQARVQKQEEARRLADDLRQLGFAAPGEDDYAVEQ